ncbi:MAG: hypothetical protein COU09_01230 [Candidatus Harrisonbacteria bacterium CG10_big_fil_rev_8_21_14_0_10_44_23]|uniref:UDP-N-acetylmuramoyl-L-alanyl-D-glutamate--2, 6-diaminopimelate ligase n=1 Tax=Candidatus Harrisonbacteria bacterium CG10_big_fil_rev_8_21_14_0_10_44_23 TaxID=1974585 RepID=A0A2H0UQ71_9BACT|nr:MAG: hypothetical protein COU09_01230 [Candidatus Harrisonbacteria bacterium CG10_big_fil_rev_8_21_14_0_10_44_23]
MRNIYHFLIAWVSSIIYRRPSRKLYVIGITGTKGKSSTIELLSAIFDFAGKTNAALSTVHRKIANQREMNKTGNTMPGRWYIQKFFRNAVDAGCEYAFLEVTSQGIVQHRHKFINFSSAALTGLHPEHIESHGSFENYREAKVQLFRYVSKKARPTKPIFFVPGGDPNTFAFKAAVSRGKIIEFSGRRLLKEKLSNNTDQLGSWFESEFNLSNAALAVEIALSQGIKWPTIYSALRGFQGVPGRMEFFSGKVQNPEKGPQEASVVLDYAHTPDSLEAVYSFLKKKLDNTPGKLICILGSAGGGRDKWKRPLMGKVADRYCDKIILTSEDPYNENPQTIIDAIKEGITATEKIQIILDRKEAIQSAIQNSISGDLVVITGMGPQAWFYKEKGQKLPWNEAQTIQDAFDA